MQILIVSGSQFGKRCSIHKICISKIFVKKLRFKINSKCSNSETLEVSGN